MSEDKSCAMYLGVFINEQLLFKIFKNVKQMPLLNPGYDFACNKGMKVDAKSSAGSRSAKSAKKSAVIRLQKKAAGLGGMIVLITKEESIGGFGEPPTYQVEGIAYGYEPPKKEETN